MLYTTELRVKLMLSEVSMSTTNNVNEFNDEQKHLSILVATIFSCHLLF